jgi:glycosyltransferase involved in cell wall biosynthesis
MNTSPKVSILIPCYNAEQWIAQAIESALNQTYLNKEVIVIDDGSTDNSLEIIKSFGDKIRWETIANKGGNATRNRLLELSTGEWLQYLDADDYLLPDKIEKQIQFLNQNSNVEVIYCPHITEDIGANGILQIAPEITKYSEQPDLWLLAIEWHIPQTGGMLFNKQALLDIDGWNENLRHCQDYDLYVRLLAADKKFIYFKDSGAVYRWLCSGNDIRRKLLEIYRDRLDIQQAIENYLISSDRLTEIRQEAINQVRFEYARRIYAFNKKWAIEIAAKIEQQDPSFEPSNNIAPQFYGLIYKILGFLGAEYVAQIKRKFWNYT